MNKVVEIYTDGAAIPNPGAGGWGVVLCFGKHKKEASGSVAFSTNNQIEMKAIFEGLSLVDQDVVRRRGYSVVVYSDSQLAVKWLNGINQCNRDEIDEIRAQIEEINKGIGATFEWIRRDSHPMQRRADELAKSAARMIE